MDIEEKRLYWVWADMVQRCKNPNHRAWKNYGGRGVCVSTEFSDSAFFIEFMSPRPVGGMLERIDNNKGYEIGNVRWATRTEQNRNRRSCVYVCIDGKTMTMKEACETYGIKYRPVVKRIRDRGWDAVEALTTPIRGRKEVVKA